ncbi:MAG: 50S ribosomal protein L4 [Microgenomates group bacterium]
MATTTKVTKTIKTKKIVKTVKAVKVATGITAPVYNLRAEKIEDMSLPKNVFGVKVNDSSIALAVRAYLANKRSARATVKERGDVAGTTKKMYAQKGTGQARHSTAKVGIFVGGGSVHGPQGTQNYTIKLNKKFKQSTLNQVLSKFAAAQKVLIVEDFSKLAPKTKEAWNFMELLEKNHSDLATSKKIGIIVPAGSNHVTRAFRNIPGFSIFTSSSLNVYQLSLQNTLIFAKDSILAFK